MPFLFAFRYLRSLMKRKLDLLLIPNIDIENFVYGNKSRQSHFRVKVVCTSQISTKCKKEVITRYSEIMNSCDNHNGCYTCLYCSRRPEIMRTKNRTMKLIANIEDFNIDKYILGSHKIMRVQCSSQKSEKCTKELVSEYRHILKICNNNHGQYICMFCSRNTKFSGRGNPNTKYNIDDDFLKHIDTEFKAYLLGWIASDGSLASSGSITIAIDLKDILLLSQLRDGICEKIPIKEKKNTNLVSLTINSTNMKNDISKWLGLDFKFGESHKKSSKVRFPNLSSDILKWHFLRGYFDGDGCIHIKKKNMTPHASISSNSCLMLADIQNFAKIGNIYSDKICWSSTSSVLLLEKLYWNAKIFLHRKYKLWLCIRDWRPKKITEKAKNLLTQLTEVILNQYDQLTQDDKIMLSTPQ